MFEAKRRSNASWPLNYICLFCCILLTIAMVGCMTGQDDPAVTLERANMLSDRGKFDDAIPLYTAALQEFPDREDIYFRRGLCYENLSLNDRALQDYAKCLELQPEHLDAINNRGVVLAKEQRFDEAVEQFTRLIILQPDNILALRNRGLCYHDLEKFELAMQDYNLALEKDQTDVSSWFQRGNAFLEQNLLTEAVADYTKAIEINSEYAKAWMNRGVAKFGLGEQQAAAEDLERAQELDDNIVLPGLDWANIGSATQAAPLTEMTTAKPILRPVSSSWESILQLGISHLTENGFSNVQIVDNFEEVRCARLRGTKADNTMDVLLGTKGTADAGEVHLPALNEHVPQGLLIVQDHIDEDSGEVTQTVSTFQENWQPEADAIRSVIVTLSVQPEEAAAPE